MSCPVKAFFCILTRQRTPRIFLQRISGSMQIVSTPSPEITLLSKPDLFHSSISPTQGLPERKTWPASEPSSAVDMP